MNIQEALSNIMKAVLGKDVRQSIHDGIEQCYKDATGHPDSVAAVVKENQNMADLLAKTPYTIMEEEEEMELPIHSINDDVIGENSTWSSQKIKSEIPVIPTIQMAEPIYQVGYESYGDSQKPTLYYVDFGTFRLVHFVGAFKKNNLFLGGSSDYTTKIRMATLPSSFYPMQAIQVLSQASEDKKYLLNLDTDGSISVSRYGDIVVDETGIPAQVVPENAWLTVNVFYITNSKAGVIW